MSEQGQQAAAGAGKPDAAAVAAQAAQQVLNGQQNQQQATNGNSQKASEGTTEAPAVGAAVAGDKQAQQPAAYYPKDFADTWKGKTDQETIDNMAKHIGALPKAPAKAEDYKLELPADMAKAIGDPSKDPALKVFREVALKHRLPQEAFNGIVKDFYGQLVEQGVWKPMSAEQVYQVFDELGGKTGDPVQRRAEGARRLQEAQNAVNGLATRGILTKDEANTLNVLTTEAAGVAIIEKIMAQLGQKGVVVPPGGGQGQGADTEEARARKMFPLSVKKTA